MSLRAQDISKSEALRQTHCILSSRFGLLSGRLDQRRGGDPESEWEEPRVDRRRPRRCTLWFAPIRPFVSSSNGSGRDSRTCLPKIRISTTRWRAMGPSRRRGPSRSGPGTTHEGRRRTSSKERKGGFGLDRRPCGQSFAPAVFFRPACPEAFGHHSRAPFR